MFVLTRLLFWRIQIKTGKADCSVNTVMIYFDPSSVFAYDGMCCSENIIPYLLHGRFLGLNPPPHLQEILVELHTLLLRICFSSPDVHVVLYDPSWLHLCSQVFLSDGFAGLHICVLGTGKFSL